MQIICISLGSQSHGEEFARTLARKLGYELINRNDLLEEAARRKIPIGKLETSIIKPHLLNDKLLRELETYKAMATSILCEKALKGNIIYYGRTGHLLLPGVTNILKVRVVADMENRIHQVTEKMEFSRDKAKKYIEQVDDDRRKWVKNFYNTQWDVFTQYDIILNMSDLHAGNAASAICSLAQLPDFQATPASTTALKNLYLESSAKLLLATDKRTSRFNLGIKAANGKVTVTYPAHLSDKIEIVNSILYKLEEAEEFIFTKARTNILWIQEKYDTEDGTYDTVFKLANNWDAAVELLKFTPHDTEELISEADIHGDTSSETWRDTGIFEDGEEDLSKISKNVNLINEKFVRDGRAGGARSVVGSRKTLLNAIHKSAHYKLIVFDNTFLSLNEVARKRTLQEWSNSLNEITQTPVLNLNELESKYKFGPKHVIKLLLSCALTIGITLAIFGYSDSLLEFIVSKDGGSRIIPTISIVIFIPLFAYIYSTFTGLLLKLIKFE